MGQQQLLLIVLGVIIVGFAIVAGGQIVEKSYRQNEADLLMDRTLMIAHSAVAWKAKSDPYAGGNASYSGLIDGGFQKLFLGEETEQGRFKITRANLDTLEVTAVGKRFPEVGIRVLVIGEEFNLTDVRFDGAIKID